MRIGALTIGPCWGAAFVLVQAVQIAQLAQGQPRRSLADVKTIIVDSPGQGEFSNAVRAGVINRLSATGRFQITLDPHDADATLSVSVTEAQATHQSKGASGGRYDVTVTVRMVSKGQGVVWESAANGRLFSRTASSVADLIVKDLMRAAGRSKAKSK